MSLYVPELLTKCSYTLEDRHKRKRFIHRYIEPAVNINWRNRYLPRFHTPNFRADWGLRVFAHSRLNNKGSEYLNAIVPKMCELSSKDTIAEFGGGSRGRYCSCFTNDSRCFHSVLSGHRPHKLIAPNRNIF